MLSIVPNDSIVDLSLIPASDSLVPGSVQIVSVSFTAYLIGPTGVQIADTVVSGEMYPAP